MLETIYLHIGTPKTGSTSIQATLRRNRKPLREAGYIFPGRTPSHRELSRSFSGRIGQIARHEASEKQSEIRSQFDKQRGIIAKQLAKTDAHTAIISSESFCLMSPDAFRALADFLIPHTRHLHIVAYLRHPVARILSGVQQRIKMGHTTLDEVSMLGPRPPTAKALDALRQAVPEATFTVRPFDREQLYRNDAVRDFFSLAGMPDAVVEDLDHYFVNTSISYEAILLSDALNRQFPIAKDGKPNTERAGDANRVMSRIGGAKFTVTPEQAAKMQESCAEEIDRIQALLGITLAEPKFPAQAELWGQGAQDDIAAAINGLLLENQRLAAEVATLRNTLSDAPDRAPRRFRWSSAMMRARRK